MGSSRVGHDLALGTPALEAPLPQAVMCSWVLGTPLCAQTRETLHSPGLRSVRESLDAQPAPSSTNKEIIKVPATQCTNQQNINSSANPPTVSFQDDVGDTPAEPQVVLPIPEGPGGQGLGWGRRLMHTARTIRIFRGIMTESENTAAPESPSFFLLSSSTLQVRKESAS